MNTQNNVLNFSSAQSALATHNLINTLLAYPVATPEWRTACEVATAEQLQAALAQCRNNTGVTATALRNAIASRES